MYEIPRHSPSCLCARLCRSRCHSQSEFPSGCRCNPGCRLGGPHRGTVGGHPTCTTLEGEVTAGPEGVEEAKCTGLEGKVIVGPRSSCAHDPGVIAGNPINNIPKVESVQQHRRRGASPHLRCRYRGLYASRIGFPTADWLEKRLSSLSGGGTSTPSPSEPARSRTWHQDWD